MGIQQDIVSLDHKLDDEDSFVVFPTDDKTENYGKHHSENLLSTNHAQMSGTKQLFCDGAEQLQKMLSHSLMKQFAILKKIFEVKRYCQFQKDFIPVSLPSNKSKTNTWHTALCKKIKKYVIITINKFVSFFFMQVLAFINKYAWLTCLNPRGGQHQSKVDIRKMVLD